MSRTLENRVRTAARALATAIERAEAAGFRVLWPQRAADLPVIAVSATGRMTERQSGEIPRSDTTSALADV